MNQVMKNLLLDSKDGEWGKSEASDNSVAMLAIRGTDFQNVRLGLLHSVPLRHIPNRIAVRKALRPLDIIFETAGGSTDRPTGRSVLLTEKHFRGSTNPITCASFARFLRIDPVKADPEYVFWLLQNMYSTGVLRQYNTQHTGVARFQYTTFAENESLELPSREVQRRIASILSAYDDLIENNTRRIAILEEMARRLFEEWFVRFRFPGHEGVPLVESELGLVPQGWGFKKVNDIVLRLPSGVVYKQADVSPEGTVPVIDQSTSELLGFHDNLPAHQASAAAPVVIFGDHTCKMQLMVTPFSLGPNTVPFVAKELAVQYVFWVVRGLIKTQEYKRHWSDLMKKSVVVAPVSIAQSFAEQVQSMAEFSEMLKRKNRNLRTTRDLLLPKLISGELDVSTLPAPQAETL